MAIPMRTFSLPRSDTWDLNSQKSFYHSSEEIVLNQDGLSHTDSFSLLRKYGHKSSIPFVENKAIKKRIHWRYPTVMVLTLLFGLLLAIGHHFYYRWLDGQAVGSAADQQWSLRIGNGFAIIITYLLKLAVGISYVQYLWRYLQHHPISFKTINDIFNVQNEPLSFLNWEFLSKMRMAVILATIPWLLPLATVFAPPTLSVTSSQISTLSHINVPSIGISNSSLTGNFVDYDRAYNPPVEASPQLARIVGAVAMSGRPESLQPPTLQSNMSYTLRAYAPLLKCASGNKTVQSQLVTTLVNVSSNNGDGSFGPPIKLKPHNVDKQTLQWNHTLNAEEAFYGDIGYFGVAPFATSRQSLFRPDSKYIFHPWWTPSQVSSDTELDIWGLGGQLWIAIPTSAFNTTDEPQMDFINCQLYNSSLTIGVEFNDRTSNIKVLDNQWVNNLYTSSFGDIKIAGTSYNGSIFSYFAYFQEVSSYLVGYVSWWNNGFNGIETSQDTQLLDTYLATSYQSYNMLRSMKTAANITGEIYPKNQLRNISFAKDIEDFAMNVTLSLLSDSALCNMINTTIHTTAPETVYNYKSKNLIIVYACVWAASALSVLIGAFALNSNGEAYDTKISTIATTMQSPDVREILHTYSTARSLDESLGKVKLRFAGSKGWFVKDDDL